MQLPESSLSQEWEKISINSRKPVTAVSDHNKKQVSEIMSWYVPKWLYSYPQDDRSDIRWDRTRHLWSTPFNPNNK
jgi:hypothetical protein